MGLKAPNDYPAMPPPPPATTLEVTVISAEDVRLPDGRPMARGAYATVRAAASAASTDVDRDECNGYPWWNETLRLALPAHARELSVEVLRRRPGGAVEAVAGATVPAEDFAVGPPGHLHCLSYRLFDAAAGGRGGSRRNGIVNISVVRVPANGEIAVGGSAVAPGPAWGEEKGKAGCASSSGGSCEGGVPGVVMGYPVGISGHGKN